MQQESYRNSDIMCQKTLQQNFAIVLRILILNTGSHLGEVVLLQR